MNNQKKSVNQNNFLIRSSSKLKMAPTENADYGKKEESFKMKASPAGEVPASKYLSPIEFNQATIDL